jgi:hypothetical protein
MLYGKLVQSSQALLHRTRAQLYIYLRGHNQDITPDNSRLTLSYAKPANLVPDAPKQPTIAFKLDPELEELLERQIFEEYKRKVLHGTVDEVKEVRGDLCRKNPIHSGGKNPSPSTTSPVSAKLTSWPFHTPKDWISKIASIKSILGTLRVSFRRRLPGRALLPLRSRRLLN